MAVSLFASLNMMKHKKLGNFLITLGILLLVGAAALVVGNLLEQEQAEAAAQDALDSLVSVIPTSPESDPEVPEVPTEYVDEDYIEYPDYILNPEMEMPEYEIDGVAYIGQLEIPALELTLPVISDTTYPDLKTAPCRYAGSAYLDNLVIGAHNYARHFGGINKLAYGAEVVFTDMDGNVFNYQVANIEILQPNEVDELCSGEWPLTLYTCTLGGRTRVTVRCERLENDEIFLLPSSNVN